MIYSTWKEKQVQRGGRVRAHCEEQTRSLIWELSCANFKQMGIASAGRAYHAFKHEVSQACGRTTFHLQCFKVVLEWKSVK